MNAGVGQYVSEFAMTQESAPKSDPDFSDISPVVSPHAPYRAEALSELRREARAKLLEFCWLESADKLAPAMSQ